jgi:hypothetical protein
VITKKETQFRPRRRAVLIGIGGLAAGVLGTRIARAASMQPDGAAPRTGAHNTAAPAGLSRAALYEEDPADANGKRHGGVAQWTLDTHVDTDHMPEMAIRASIAIPDREMIATWTLRRNRDKLLPASHTIEMVFKRPPNSHDGVDNVPGVLVKTSETGRGAPLTGTAVKVMAGFFLFGLSAVDAERDANVAMLKEREWIDVPIVYDNGRRAILTFAKGASGRRVFADVFADWEGPFRPAPPDDHGDAASPDERGVIK